MNYCLRNKCPNGYAFIQGFPHRLDSHGSISYSVTSNFSGITHDATAFVGCDAGKCCACFGPKGGRDHYCNRKCKPVNGGTILQGKVYVWYWIRTRIPKRLWKRCMEFTRKTEAGKSETYYIDRRTGAAHKGSCSEQFQTFLSEGTLLVKNKQSFENLPRVSGMLSYREDNQKLYVNKGNEWDAICSEKETKNLTARVSQLQHQNSKQDKQIKNLGTNLNTKLQTLRSNITQQDNQIQNLDNKNSQQDNKIQNLVNKTSQQDNQIQNLDNKNSQQDNQIQNLDNKNSQQDNQIQNLDNKNSQQDNQIQNLDNRNSQQDKQIQNLCNKNSQQDNQIESLKDELKRIETKINSLSNSKSLPGKSCKDILARITLAISGTYWIQPANSNKPFQVYCDMETHGDGWTLVYSYTFTNYNSFLTSNAVTPRPNWLAPKANVPISTTPPLGESSLGAVDWNIWKDIGKDFIVKSNINDWIVCQSSAGSIVVEKHGSSLSCQNIKNVATACSSLVPNAIFWLSGGPTLSLNHVHYYYFSGSTRYWPTHDPCGRGSLNHKKGVSRPGGQIYLR